MQQLTVDTPGTPVTCGAGKAMVARTARRRRIKLDRTAPAVSATPERIADANGWYTRPLAVHFSGTDPISDFRRFDLSSSSMAARTP